MSTLHLTPLYELHQHYAAKMTAFAGYQMPIQYPKGIIHEHLHCRSHAGLFDISHMGQCQILGDQAATALDKLTPGGIADLKIGQQKYSVLTNAAGGVIDDIIVTRRENGMGIIVNAACKAKDFAHLRSNLPTDCEFHELNTLALLALQGPAAATVLAKYALEAVKLRFMHACCAVIHDIPCNISRNSYCGEDGFEISLPQQATEQLALSLLAEPNVELIGLGARDTLRLEAGLCLYGHELNDNITPIEAGLKWLIKKGHSDFPGADKILAQYHNGTDFTRVGILVESKIPVRDGCQLYDAADHVVGRVSSGSYSPSLNQPIAMASIATIVAQPGLKLYAIVRDQKITVQVCRLPFVPHRYLKDSR